jgi:hypothetical protein
MRARPAALWVADDGTREKAAANGQHGFEANFPDHRLKRVLHIKPQLTKALRQGVKLKLSQFRTCNRQCPDKQRDDNSAGGQRSLYAETV